jgi:hypothetical protein
MMKLLAAAGLVAMLGACGTVNADRQAQADDPAFEGPGAVVAASLGFHGPVERGAEPANGRLYSRNGN